MTGETLETKANKTRSFEIGSLVQHKYLLKRLLGHGTYGVVYAAENVVHGGHVALKFLGRQSRDAASRFEQETKVANSIGHPNICRVIDSGRTNGGTPFFVMESLTGLTLRSRLAFGALDATEAVGLMSQVLSALGAAHALGIIHSDIKPENIFLAERDGLDPVAKVLDFGLAQLPAPQSSIRTAQGLTTGTKVYMAPEQLAGDPASASSDQFSTAVVLYEAIAGRHPFRGLTPEAVTNHILHDPPSPLSAAAHCPLALDAVVARALAKRPSGRYGSARELQTAMHLAIGLIDRPRTVLREARPVPSVATESEDGEC